MKLTPRFTFVFILYAAVLLLGVGFVAYNSGRASLRAAAVSELRGTILEKEASLTSWVLDKEADIVTLSSDPALIDDASVLLTTMPGTTARINSYRRFILNVQPYLSSGKFLEVSLIHPETGEVLASTDASEEGKFKEDRLYFLEGKVRPYIQNPYYSVTLQKITMTAAAPLFDSNGQLLGVLAARLDLNNVNDIIGRRTGLRETDDAYLVNPSNLFVTQPRFIQDSAVLLRGIYTEDIEQCLQQQSGEMNTLDYRGTPAIVAYRWLPERDLCLVVKLDETEAYGPVRAFGGTIFIISVAALLIAAAIATALARGLTRPIQALQAGTARFARGELDQKLDERSNDELGQLAAEFNKMADALTEQQTHMRRRAEQFFNLTLDLLCTVYPSGQFLDLNPAWESTLGYKQDELKGRLLEYFIHPDDVYRSKAAFQRVLKDSTATYFEGRFRHQDGHYLWLAWSVTASPQEDLLYIAARDTTEQHLSESRLRQQAEDLERSNRELEQFAHAASHDLQEPLRLVTTYVELLANRYKGQLDAEADEFIEYALDGANHMKSLMEDLLTYSRLGTQSRQITNVEMEDALQRTLDKLQPAIQRTSATVTHDPLPAILGDMQQMTQLLENLIGNSLKFCRDEPPRIHVGVNSLNDRWLFFIRDNGIGIDPLHTERIFVIFQRLHPPEEYPGNGIGLAICRKIVEEHGGRIWVDSEPGKGSTFYFTLQPAADWPTEPIQVEAAKPERRDAIADRATDLI